jgi:hypothetical protein
MGVVASTFQAFKLINDVKRQFGDLNNVQISDENILDWGNQAQRQVVSDLLPADTVSKSVTVADQAGYDIPPNCYQIKNVVVNGRLLIAMSFENAMAQYGANFDLKGNPDIFYTWESSIVLYPTPTDVLDFNVFYCKAPDLLVNNASFMGVPDRYYNAVLQLTMSYAHEMDEQPDLLNASLGAYRESKSSLSHQHENMSGAFPVVNDPVYDSYDWSPNAWF